MRIEKLTDNKIRIILNLEDLAERNIDFHSFMSNSIDTQDLFYDMLDEAEEKIGFVTKDYKLSIEAIATSEGNFILTVTRMSQDKIKPSLKKMSAKRKTVKLNKGSYIYCFNTFDNFCEFCSYFYESNLNALSRKLSNSCLYSYNSKYYLTLNNISLSLVNFKKLHCSITEFASLVNNSELFNNKLKEYGKIVFKKNAITSCIKYFVK